MGDPMEDNTPDDENSGCIGAESAPEVIVVQASTDEE